jgi:7-carboxy-7-deazaguanine synthase
MRRDFHHGLLVLTINEIFHSIQGESTYAGLPCVFVRLTGCDLRCTWCDTAYAFHAGRKMSVEEVMAAITPYPCRLVELTGGEPLLQDAVYRLIDRLIDGGWEVLVEIGGHLSTERLPASVVTILDVKCPASGESDRQHWDNLRRLAPHDQVKFVIQDRADYEYAREIVEHHDLPRRCAAVLFSPVHGVLPAKQLAQWVLADGLAVRVQLQVHKYIWGADARGV